MEHVPFDDYINILLTSGPTLKFPFIYTKRVRNLNYCPWKFRKFVKSLTPFELYIVETSHHLKWNGPLQNEKLKRFTRPICFCSLSFNYSPAGYIITVSVNVVNHDDLKSLILKGPNFREPQSFNWHFNFIHIMNSVEEYSMVQTWKDLDALFEWTKIVQCMLKSRIQRLKRSMKTIYFI